MTGRGWADRQCACHPPPPSGLFNTSIYARWGYRVWGPICVSRWRAAGVSAAERGSVTWRDAAAVVAQGASRRSLASTAGASCMRASASQPSW